MGDGLGILLLLILSVAALVAFMIVLGVLFPRRIAAARDAAAAAPGRAFLLGAVNLVFFGAVGMGFWALAEAVGFDLLALLGLVVIFALAVGLLLGLSGVSRLVGERLAPAAGSTRQHLWGALALILGSLMPFVGWFFLFPYAALLGLGGVILGLFRGRAEAVSEDVSQG